MTSSTLLAEQSLVTVAEVDGSMRFRMLETVREFAADRLNTMGLRGEAHARQDDWAAAFAELHGAGLFGPGELAAIDALGAEENNLADVLRRALRDGDRALVARLLSTLGALWTMTGNHPRVFAIADAAEASLVDWDPPEELRETAQVVLSWLIVHLSWMPHRSIDGLRSTLERWGPPTHPWAKVAYRMFVDEPRAGVSPDDYVAALADDSDPVTAQMALLWAALVAENAGDIDAAFRHAQSGLTHLPLTPYLEASLHSQLAQLAMSRGDHRTAAEHAAVAWPLLRRMHADDDARSVRALEAMNDLLEGRLDEAERTIDEIARDGAEAKLGSQMVLFAARAELALARGQIDDGLRLFDEALASVERFEGVDFGGLSPWVMLAASGSLVARVRFGTTAADAARAAELSGMLVRESGTVIDGDLPFSDFPLNGVLVAALGAYLVRPGSAARARGRRTPARPRRPLGLQPQLPDDVVGRPARARRARSPGLLDVVAGRVRRPAGGRSRRGGPEPAEACHIFRVKARTASGAKIAITARQPSSAQPTSAVTVPVLARSRSAVTMWVTGLILVNASSQSAEGVGRDERVGQERQREHHHQRVALHRLGAPPDRCRTR